MTETLFDLPEANRQPQQRTVLMSIVTKQARKIMAGTKEWEFRKAFPRMDEGDSLTVVVYSSQGDRSIIGEFAAAQIVRCGLSELMEVTGYAGDAEAEAWFGKYYGDRQVCGAMQVQNPVEYKRPIELAEVYANVPDFRVPQAFMYVEPGSPLAGVIDQHRA